VCHCTGNLGIIEDLLREVETRYCSVFASKFAEPEIMMGGVIIPANMARAAGSKLKLAKILKVEKRRFLEAS
jgi:hypothetical protein